MTRSLQRFSGLWQKGVWTHQSRPLRDCKLALGSRTRYTIFKSGISSSRNWAQLRGSLTVFASCIGNNEQISFYKLKLILRDDVFYNKFANQRSHIISKNESWKFFTNVLLGHQKFFDKKIIFSVTLRTIFGTSFFSGGVISCHWFFFASVSNCTYV